MTMNIAEQTWRDRAACLGMDSDIFFPERTEGRRTDKEAKAICATCPVTEACLDYAVSVWPPMKFGVWGGKTERQLRAIRHERFPAPLENEGNWAGCDCRAPLEPHASAKYEARHIRGSVAGLSPEPCEESVACRRMANAEARRRRRGY